VAKPDEADVEALARRILRAARPSPVERVRGAFDPGERLMTWATKRPDFKTGLFRFVDVFPACTSPHDVLDHLDEYLVTGDTPRVVRAGLAAAHTAPFGARAARRAARAGIHRMARQFIGGTTPAEAAGRARALWKDGYATTVDLLGEKTLTLADADVYADRVQTMLAALRAAAARFSPRPLLERDPWGEVPRVNISVKASALAPLLAPPTAEQGIAEALDRLGPILDQALEANATIHLDAEHDELKDVTYRLLREIGARYPEGPQLGCVVQAYRVDAVDDVRDLVEWSADTLVRPLQVRLVKGAYWDGETIRARAHGWKSPVWADKDATDASYELCASLLVAAAGDVRPAFASHNARSIAWALCAARAEGLADDAVEIQVLHGMAEPLHDAVRDLGVRTRVYVPVGELVPGMAYLVRRLLENTSNESFVRRRYTEGWDVESLVAPPAPGPRAIERARERRPPTDPDEPGRFVNEPPAELRRVDVQTALVDAVARVERELDFPVPLLVDGTALDTRHSIVSVDPGRTTVTVCRSASAAPEHVDLAVQAARRTAPKWRAASWRARAAVLFRAADLMRRRRDELAALCVLEAGKPLAEADADVCEAIDFCEYYGRRAVQMGDGARVLQPPGEANQYWYQPRGVGAVIAPWNFPLAIPTGMVTAALVTGNTVVFKPAEQTPGVAARLVEILLEAGLPPGALSFVPGVGETIGPLLVDHPDIAFVTFTGSKAVGLEIMQRAAVVHEGQRHVKRVVAEMGGKNAIIVDADADLDDAVPAVVQSAFGYAGQKCSAASRVIVVDDVYDAFVTRLTGAAELLPLGHARDPATVVGPLIDGDAYERVRSYQQLARNEGRVTVDRTDVPAGGWYVGPTVVELTDPRSRIATEEIFGPVLAVLRARDFERAITIANDTEYALTAGCFSRSPSHLERAATELRAGNVYLNRGTTGAVVGRQPFGGFGLSGVGSKAGGPDYLLQFVEPRSVSENTLRQGFAPESP
jgi:RHH-type transcriptional regulator, proline utilization regulon repressor / proline dehydrogenase / delta 1-pyrroline-5-carboxylate dehydrogenase